MHSMWKCRNYVVFLLNNYTANTLMPMHRSRVCCVGLSFIYISVGLCSVLWWWRCGQQYYYNFYYLEISASIIIIFFRLQHVVAVNLCVFLFFNLERSNRWVEQNKLYRWCAHKHQMWNVLRLTGGDDNNVSTTGVDHVTFKYRDSASHAISLLLGLQLWPARCCNCSYMHFSSHWLTTECSSDIYCCRPIYHWNRNFPNDVHVEWLGIGFDDDADDDEWILCGLCDWSGKECIQSQMN